MMTESGLAYEVYDLHGLGSEVWVRDYHHYASVVVCRLLHLGIDAGPR